MKNNTIFVQIASYRDPELLPTIKDCLEKAKYSENLTFGICWQHSSEDKWDNLDRYKNDSRFKIIDVDYKESKGVCWARNQVQQLYQNEKYTLQLDSHHRFVENWDEILIDMMTKLQKEGHPKPLITGYIPSFDPQNDPEGRVQQPWKMNFDRFIPEGAVFFIPGGFDTWDDNTKPLPARFYSAHFCFTIGDFAKEIQHDPNYYFHGEEISIAVRAFTHGYDLFHPHVVVAWHEYTRKGRTKQWDDDKTWHFKNKDSHLRNRKLFEMDGEKRDIDFGKYGLGSQRTLLDYEKYAGISFEKRSVAQKTLDRKPPNINKIISDEEFEASLTKLFKHYLNIHKESIPLSKNYDFWAVILKDSNDKEIYRKDLQKQEISKLIQESKDNNFYVIKVEFFTEENPIKYIVWPYIQTEGWSDKVVSGLI